MGEPKCVWCGGGEVIWLGVVLPEAKNKSEQGVPNKKLENN